MPFAISIPKELPALGALLARANDNGDAASVFVIGNNWETAQGAVIVIKGRHAAELTCDVLKEHKLIRHGEAAFAA